MNAFALKTGFRLAECVGLRWDDVDFGDCRLVVRGKGGKVVSLPMSTTVRDLLWTLRGQHPEAVFAYAVQKPRTIGDFVRRKGERLPITYSGMKTVWRRYAGIPNFRFHDTRHTAATRLLRSSGNLRLVQKLLRHDEITTTTKYAHADDRDLETRLTRLIAGKIARTGRAPNRKMETG